MSGDGEVEVAFVEVVDVVEAVEDGGVVAGEDEDGVVLGAGLLEEAEDGVTGGGVEGGGGFIGEEELGFVGDGAGDGDAEALAGAHLGGAVVGVVGEADLVEEVEGAWSAFVFGLAGEGEGHGDVLGGG